MYEYVVTEKQSDNHQSIVYVRVRIVIMHLLGLKSIL